MIEKAERRYGPLPGCVGKTHHDHTHPWNASHDEHYREKIQPWLPTFRNAETGRAFSIHASLFKRIKIDMLMSDMEHHLDRQFVYTRGRPYRFMAIS